MEPAQTILVSLADASITKTCAQSLHEAENLLEKGDFSSAIKMLEAEPADDSGGAIYALPIFVQKIMPEPWRVMKEQSNLITRRQNGKLTGDCRLIVKKLKTLA